MKRLLKALLLTLGMFSLSIIVLTVMWVSNSPSLAVKNMFMGVLVVLVFAAVYFGAKE
jgi:uncharacterized membrane protein (DUF373 family)